MKIVCDSCQAKYSIADEKVQGKAFKIRCKKCSHIIVVKSGAGESASAARAVEPARPADADVQGVWHIVVEGQQVGPLTEVEIRSRLGRGEIGNDTLVWKEGFADWVKLSTVAELTEIPTPQAQPAHRAEPAAQQPAQPRLAPASHSRHTPAAQPRHTPARELPAAAAPASSSPAAGDVFGAPAPAAKPAADLFAASAAPAAERIPANPETPFSFGAPAAQPAEPMAARPGNGAGSAHLTGQRNENSVLFSLANLEALAVPQTGGGGVRPPSATSNTEGSGLIDIRSMAAMTLGDAPGGEGRAAADSLPTFSTPQFSPVAPVLLPMVSSGPPKWVYPVLGVVGLVVIGLGYGIYRVVSVPPPPPPPVVKVPVVAPPPPAAPAASAVAAAPAPSAAPAEPAAPRAAAAAEEKTSDKKPSRSGRGSKGSPAKATAAAPASKTPEPVTAAPVEPAKPAARRGSIDDLLGEVGGSRRAAPSGGDEPKKASVALVNLSQSDIVKAMQAVQPKVKGCYDQFKVPGTALANVSVSKGGRVGSVKVQGKFAGTPTGSCVESAVRSAKFPPCEPMNFPWPFQLR